MTDFTDDEALAAEYVLGTLDAEERAAAASRRDREPAFNALVTEWETRLAPLAAAAPALAPPPELFTKLLGRLPVDAPADYANDNVLTLRRQIRVWRGVAALASALAAVLAIWVVGREALAPGGANQTYVAVLQQGANQASFVVSLDLATRQMVVRPLATSAPAGKSYELWMIGGANAVPQSIGVLQSQEPLRPHLPDVDKSVLSTATYAVTLEPQGGSPNGKPSGAPLFVGKLMNTSL